MGNACTEELRGGLGKYKLSEEMGEVSLAISEDPPLITQIKSYQSMRFVVMPIIPEKTKCDRKEFINMDSFLVIGDP